eukprot:6194922-Pleurochrysis_carterae.AAC.1
MAPTAMAAQSAATFSKIDRTVQAWTRGGRAADVAGEAARAAGGEWEEAACAANRAAICAWIVASS